MNEGNDSLVEHRGGHMRVQDIVARVAGVNLKDTVKVIRTLHLFMQALGEEDAEAVLSHYIDAGSFVNGEEAPMHEKPGAGEVAACERIYALMVANVGVAAMSKIKEKTV